jgi:hypothetical protein
MDKAKTAAMIYVLSSVEQAGRKLGKCRGCTYNVTSNVNGQDRERAGEGALGEKGSARDAWGGWCGFPS